MRLSPALLNVTDAERRALLQIIHRPMGANGVATRARIVLLFADGMSTRQIAQCLYLQRKGVSMWLSRFLKERLDGLSDLPRSGRPPAFSPGGRPACGQDSMRVAG